MNVRVTLYLRADDADGEPINDPGQAIDATKDQLLSMDVDEIVELAVFDTEERDQ